MLLMMFAAVPEILVKRTASQVRLDICEETLVKRTSSQVRLDICEENPGQENFMLGMIRHL